MLELKRDFGMFLRKPAIFEGVRKLVRFADPHQKLGLGEQAPNLHAGLRSRGGERREIDVRRQILLARSLVRVGTGGMLPIRHECPAVPSGKLLLARVAVVDNEKRAP